MSGSNTTSNPYLDGSVPLVLENFTDKFGPGAYGWPVVVAADNCIENERGIYLPGEVVLIDRNYEAVSLIERGVALPIPTSPWPPPIKVG